MLENIFNKCQYFDSKDVESIKKKGVVFTKKEICDIIIHELAPKITNTICEPSVGKGIFVFSLLEYFRNNGTDIPDLVFFVENRLWCYDINDEFINELKVLLIEYFNLFGYTESINLNNIKCEDYLLSDNKFDITLGNPPYVRIQNLEKSYLNKLKKIGFKSLDMGNIDLYYAFIEKSLKDSNKVSFIIPNSFLKNKTGINLRKIINKSVYKIIDNRNDKVWENIATYTCMIFCDNNNNSYSNFEYITDVSSLIIDKTNVNWFEEKTNKVLEPIISFIGGGIATLRDKIYRFDTCDEEFVYKGDIKIEKDICCEAYKATTKKTYWFLYPYDDGNKILSIDILRDQYPLAYDYLLGERAELDKRDGGNLDKLSKYDAWYAYGRKQGLLKYSTEDQVKLILPLTFLKNNIHYKVIEDDKVLPLSGLTVIIDRKDLKRFDDIIRSEDFHNYLENSNKILADKNPNNVWLTLTVPSVKRY